MSDVFGSSLLITLIAIGVLFLVLVLLAVVIRWLTSIIKPSVDEDESDEEAAEEETEAQEATGAGEAVLDRNRVAAIAVALARAEFETGFAGPVVAEREFNPWGEYHRARLLNQSGRVRRF